MPRRTVLLSGACGSGKSTVADLGYSRLSVALGPTASIDTDRLFMMIDPTWELPYDPARLALVLSQVGLLVQSLFDFRIETVLVVGNALHTPEELDLLLPALLEGGEVFHLTLDPTPEEIIRRVRLRGDDKTDQWLRDHVEWMRQRYGPWTVRINNTALDPAQTLSAIASALADGHGRLERLFADGGVVTTE